MELVEAVSIAVCLCPTKRTLIWINKLLCSSMFLLYFDIYYSIKNLKKDDVECHYEC